MSDIICTAWRSVATARLDAFHEACWMLADAYRHSEIEKIAAVDELQAIADAHGLGETFGADYIAALMAEAFHVPRMRLVFHDVVRAAA